MTSLFILNTSGVEENSMMYFEVSPDGKYLVFLGKYGRMHLISSKVTLDRFFSFRNRISLEYRGILSCKICIHIAVLDTNQIEQNSC